MLLTAATDLKPVLSFSLASIALLASPGPATVALAASGASFGLRRSLKFYFGIVVGLIPAIALVAGGVFVALRAVPVVSSVLFAVSVAYILCRDSQYSTIAVFAEAWISPKDATCPAQTSAIRSSAEVDTMHCFAPSASATSSSASSGTNIADCRTVLPAVRVSRSSRLCSELFMCVSPGERRSYFTGRARASHALEPDRANDPAANIASGERSALKPKGDE